MSVVSKQTIEKYLSKVTTSGYQWSESELVSFRSLINTKLSDAPDLRAMLLDRFNAALEIVPYQLTQQQQDKGVQWLLKTQCNAKGQLRDSAAVFIGEFELAIVRDMAIVELVGLRDLQRSSCSGYRSYVPVYRVTGRSGASFDYAFNYSGGFDVTSISYAA